MTFLQELKRDYKATYDTMQEAKLVGNKELEKEMAHRLVKIADLMEGEE